MQCSVTLSSRAICSPNGPISHSGERSRHVGSRVCAQRRAGRGVCAAAASRPLCGDGIPDTSADERQLRIQSTQERMAAHQELLHSYVERQDYGHAAEQRDALRMLELRLRGLQLEEAAEAKRRGGVQHSLGMVVLHRRFGYKGVIIGYDYSCQAPEEWCQTMHVDMLPHGRLQPFYRVLVDVRDRPGGQTTYVAQENIVPARGAREVSHPLLPRFFTAFSLEERCYVAGPVLRESYPLDF